MEEVVNVLDESSGDEDDDELAKVHAKVPMPIRELPF
jgi:hypothetical protein